MQFQKTRGFRPNPNPIFTNAIQLQPPILPNPNALWKLNDVLIVPERAFREDANPSFFTEGLYVGKHESGLDMVRVPVSTTWGTSNALYLLDRRHIINESAYIRAGVNLPKAQS